MNWPGALVEPIDLAVPWQKFRIPMNSWRGYCQVESFRADPTPRCWQRGALKPHYLAARSELETST